MNMTKKILAMLALLSSCAVADVGFGYDQTLAGLGGLSLEYKTDGSILFQVIGNFTGDTSTTVIGVGARVFYPLIETSTFHAYVGLGADYATCNTSVLDSNQNLFSLQGCRKWYPKYAGEAAPSYPLVAELPFRIDYQVLPMLSLHTQAGLRYGTNDTDKNFGLRGNLIATAGFTIWLGGTPSSPAVASKPKPKKTVKVVEAEDDDDATPVAAPVPVKPTPTSVQAKPVPTPAVPTPAASLDD